MSDPVRVMVAWQATHDGADPAEALARRAARDLTGADVAGGLGHLCSRCGSDAHGRPFLRERADLAVSVARTAGLVAVAVSDAAGVGVDVERPDAPNADLAGVVRHPEEPADTDPLRLWVRKEALLKAVGAGLSVDPRTVLLRGREVLGLPPPYGGADVVLEDLDLDAAVLASVAVLGAERPAVSLVPVARAAPAG